MCGAHTFERETPVWFVSHNCEMTIDHPLLWWPRGYGAQTWYTVTLALLRDGEVVDSVTERIGLRSLSLERSFERGSQKFQISVNGVRLMVRGTNWVPLDAMHGQRPEPRGRGHGADSRLRLQHAAQLGRRRV